MDHINQGDWVEICWTILTPEERAPGLPEDTRQTPYILKASGIALEEGKTGDEISIETQAGRNLKGQATRIFPYYNHDFGNCVPELIQIRKQIRSAAKGGTQ